MYCKDMSKHATLPLTVDWMLRVSEGKAQRKAVRGRSKQDLHKKVASGLRCA